MQSEVPRGVRLCTYVGSPRALGWRGCTSGSCSPIRRTRAVCCVLLSPVNLTWAGNCFMGTSGRKGGDTRTYMGTARGGCSFSMAIGSEGLPLGRVGGVALKFVPWCAVIYFWIRNGSIYITTGRWPTVVCLFQRGSGGQLVTSKPRKRRRWRVAAWCGHEHPLLWHTRALEMQRQLRLQWGHPKRRVLVGGSD